MFTEAGASWAVGWDEIDGFTGTEEFSFTTDFGIPDAPVQHIGWDVDALSYQSGPATDAPETDGSSEPESSPTDVTPESTEPKCSEEDYARVIVEMLGEFDNVSECRRTLNPELLSIELTKKRELGQMGLGIAWNDPGMVRQMTETEANVNVREIFMQGTVAQRLRDVSGSEDRLEQLLHDGCKLIQEGKSLLEASNEFNPSKLIELLLKPSEDLKGQMKFTSRSKGPQAVKSYVDVNFMRAVLSPFCKVYPAEMGLLPRKFWSGIDCVRFGELVEVFFQRRNHANSRFIFKLIDALLMVEDNPELYPLIGVKWITQQVIMVNKRVFAQLLGVSQSSADGALLNAQGNFSTHGFVEITSAFHMMQLQIKPQDIALHRENPTNVRFLIHARGRLQRNQSLDDLDNKGRTWPKELCSLRDVIATYRLSPIF